MIYCLSILSSRQYYKCWTKYNFILTQKINKFINIVNMKLSVTTPLQIRNHPVNNSSAKVQWSFSRASRFKTPRPNCSQSAYNNRSCLSERKTSFGYGGRTTFFDGNKKGPDPGKYQAKSDFNLQKKDKGFSFTANREDLIFSHYAKTIEATPHPAAYQQDSNQVKKKRCYSMRPKTAYPSNYFLPNQTQQKNKKQQPGPGKYQTIDVIGRKSNTKSVKNYVQPFASGKRFHNEKSTPGPMDYHNKTIEPDGIYLLSNMKGSGRRTFMGGKRKLKLDVNEENPGPGSYRAPSDFGHYESEIHPSTARA